MLSQKQRLERWRLKNLSVTTLNARRTAVLKTLNNAGGAASYILSSNVCLNRRVNVNAWMSKLLWQIVKRSRVARDKGLHEFAWLYILQHESKSTCPKATQLQKGFSARLQSMLWPFWPQHWQQTCWLRTGQRRPAVKSTPKSLSPLDFHQVLKVPSK